MKDPLVSLIIPVYNVEAYLERCLDSIVAQTYRRLEVIIINDGSLDKCDEIIDRYEAKWNFIKSYYQKNQGLGAARNAGIVKAKGEFIAFIDSDDYIEPDYVSTMIRTMQESDADVVVCRFYVHTPRPKSKPFVFPLLTKSRRLSGEDAARVSLKLYSIPSVAWNKLYKTFLFTGHDVMFPSIYYEDVATMPRVLVHARNVAVTRKPLYHYCLRESSITGQFKQKNIDDYIEAISMIKRFLDENVRTLQWYQSFRFLLLIAEAQLLVEIMTKMKSEGLSTRLKIASQMHHSLRHLKWIKDTNMLNQSA